MPPQAVHGMPDVAEYVEVPLSPQQADPYEINMSHTIYISGPHHILNNCQKDFPKVLANWEWALVRLTHLCRLLTRKYYKARLLATCYSAANTEAFADDVQNFHGHVYTERWGATAAAVTRLVPLLPMLQHAWDKDAFLHGGDVERHDAAQSCTMVGVIMKAVC